MAARADGRAGGASMLAPSEEHVSDGGKVYCGWRQGEVKVAACTKCPGFLRLRNASTTTERAIDVVSCRQPIPLA